MQPLRDRREVALGRLALGRLDGVAQQHQRGAAGFELLGLATGERGNRLLACDRLVERVAFERAEFRFRGRQRLTVARGFVPRRLERAAQARLMRVTRSATVRLGLSASERRTASARPVVAKPVRATV